MTHHNYYSTSMVIAESRTLRACGDCAANFPPTTFESSSDTLPASIPGHCDLCGAFGVLCPNVWEEAYFYAHEACLEGDITVNGNPTCLHHFAVDNREDSDTLAAVLLWALDHNAPDTFVLDSGAMGVTHFARVS